MYGIFVVVIFFVTVVMLRLFCEPTQWQSSKKFLSIIVNIVVIFAENVTCFRLFSLHLIQIWSVISIANIRNKWAQTSHRRFVCLRQRDNGRTAISLTEKCIWPHYDLELWPLTLKAFSTIASCHMNIYGRFRWNLNTSTEISPYAK